MIKLFEQDVQVNERQSSKGNQIKWKNNQIWYKADYTGYEGLAEYVISHLLRFSNLKQEEYVIYNPVQVQYKNQVYTGVSSRDFLKDGWQIVTLERLFQNAFGSGLNKTIWGINDDKERLAFLVEQTIRITGLCDFGKYMNKILTIDAVFLNEDRHTHNLAVLINNNKEYAYCPIFDNGAGLCSDTTVDYPISGDVYKLISSVKGKTFLTNLDEQMEVSEALYGTNLKFHFSKKDVDRILALDGNNGDISIYPMEMRKRVQKIIYEQMRKYQYLFV